MSIFYPFAEKPPWADLHKIVHWGQMANVINRANFFVLVRSGVSVLWGEIVAFNTGLELELVFDTIK